MASGTSGTPQAQASDDNIVRLAEPAVTTAPETPVAPAAEAPPAAVMQPSHEVEVELKLGVDPLLLARFERLDFWRELMAAPSRQLVSVYYDTPDGALAARGYRLRVRNKDSGFEQTLKQSGKATGLFTRGEWTCRQTGDQPDIAALGDVPLPEHLRHLRGDDLAVICRIDVDRKTTMLELPDGGAAELVLDIGQAMTDDSIVPLAEVELELKAGPPEQLFAVAQQLNAIAPVRLQTRSKPEQVLARQSDGGAVWHKAGNLKLAATQSVDEVLEAIFASALAHLLANERCARERLHIEGVHQMRVAVRRLRSALRLFRPLLPADARERLDGELQWLASSLGPARDMDVFRSELLDGAVTAIEDDAAFSALERQAVELQDEAYAAVAAALGSSRYSGLILELLRWRVLRAWRVQALDANSARLFQPIGDLAGELLGQAHRRARKRGRGFARLPVNERHRVRIAVKKLRYTVEFFDDLYGGPGQAHYLKRLMRLQDDLGHLNDVATAERLLGEVLGPRPPAALARAAGCILGWHRRGLHDDEGRLVRDWRRFARARPFW